MAKKKKGLSDKVRLSKAKNNSSKGLDKVRNNPFEVKINKQKHTILGRKTKHDKGLPGVSRSKANKKRKDTLLHEYKQRNKSNSIKDERFGANDEETTLEEKMLMRFSLERKKKHLKMSQFNLNEDEDLTHLGQSLSDFNKFDDYIESDDDPEGGTMSGEYVEHAHFGGGILTKKIEGGDADKDHGGRKTRKDVIDEIIARSKLAKYEKQSAKDEATDLREKLDNAWEDFQQLIQSSKRTSHDKELARQGSQPDDYDIAVKQMQFERKAAPSEKSKTKAELAAEEEERMRKEDEERLKRMEIDGDKKSDRPNHQSADALEDEFVIKTNTEEIEPLSFSMFGDEEVIEDEAGSEDANDEEEDDDLPEQESEIGDQGIVDDGDSLDAEEQDENSDDYSDIDSGNEDDVDIGSLEDEDVLEEEKIDNVKVKVHADGKPKFPSSYSEFVALISSSDAESDAAVVTVCSKLREEYAPAAGKGNKAKMIELFAYLWEHCCRMASSSPPRVKVINSLTRNLYELCSLNVDSCSQCINERLNRSYHSCFLSGKTRYPQWPSFEMLIQFKLIKLLYSTSDFRHPVVTPALLFMCNILNSCHIATKMDITCGLFLCTLVYEYVCFSKRFVPECLNFLISVLSMSVSKNDQQKLSLPDVVSIHLSNKNCDLLVVEEDISMPSNLKPDLVKLLQEEANPQCSDSVKRQLTITALKLAAKFAALYIDLPAFDEIFSPSMQLCKILSTSPHSSTLTQHVQLVSNVINSNCNKTRKPISFRKQKPVPLRLFDPRIEEPGEPFQRNSGKLDAAKREHARLLHKRRSEMKGAVREIRKDAKFICAQRQKEQEKLDEERAAKVKRLYGLLSNQEGEVRNIKRSKYKLEI